MVAHFIHHAGRWCRLSRTGALEAGETTKDVKNDVTPIVPIMIKSILWNLTPNEKKIRAASESARGCEVGNPNHVKLDITAACGRLHRRLVRRAFQTNPSCE